MKVYVAGPYSIGDVGANVRDAIIAGDRLLQAGHDPYIPHLNHFWHMIRPHAYNRWLDLDLRWLPTCDILVRLPGESPGSDKEVELAKQLNIPVYTLEELVP